GHRPLWRLGGVSRSPLPGTFITVANASGGDFDDLGLEPNPTYYWQLMIGAPPIRYAPKEQSATIPPPPPQDFQVAYPNALGFVVSWTPVAGASGYRTWQD